MNTQWIRLQSIPPEGAEKHYDSPELWTSLFTEFHIPCTIVDSLVATVFVFPQADGVLFKGTIKGNLRMPCDRCTEDSHYAINETFSGFETYPAEDPSRHDQEEADLADETDETVIRPAEKGNGLEINPLAYAWQELSLALPVKPLCTPTCKGLCPVCGCNNNTDTCTCNENAGDPRLAVLRGLTLPH